jgi:hypothetical protein
MDWYYFARLIRGLFCTITSVPTYVGLATLLLQFFPGWEGGKIKWIVRRLREHPALVCMSFLMISVVLVSHTLYANKQGSFATPDELTQSVLQKRDIRLADLAREDFAIHYKTFIDCHLYGPAIVLPKGTTTFVELRIEGSPDVSFGELSHSLWMFMRPWIGLL